MHFAPKWFTEKSLATPCSIFMVNGQKKQLQSKKSMVTMGSDHSSSEGLGHPSDKPSRPKVREIWNSRLECVVGRDVRWAEAVRAVVCPATFSYKSFPRKWDHSEPSSYSQMKWPTTERKQIQMVQGIDCSGCRGMPHRIPLQDRDTHFLSHQEYWLPMAHHWIFP